MKKSKRIIGMIIAAALVMSTTALPVFAAGGDGEGRDETIGGQGQIGWGDEKEGYTDSPEFDALNGPKPIGDPAYDATQKGERTVKGTYNADLTDGKNNIPGGAIIVYFPGGVVSKETVVDAGGNWQVDVPTDMVLYEGDELKATQKIDGKYTSPATVVVVGKGNSKPVDPPIDPPEPPIEPKNPEDYLTLTIPTNFGWWVTQETHPDVASNTHHVQTSGLEYTQTDGTVIKTDPTVAVSMKSFTQDNAVATSVASKLDLRFSKDFAVTGLDGNLNNGLTLTDKVKIGNITSSPVVGLEFGFSGKYSDPLPAKMLVPTYKMVLHFAIV